MEIAISATALRPRARRRRSDGRQRHAAAAASAQVASSVDASSSSAAAAAPAEVATSSVVKVVATSTAPLVVGTSDPKSPPDDAASPAASGIDARESQMPEAAARGAAAARRLRPRGEQSTTRRRRHAPRGSSRCRSRRAARAQASPTSRSQPPTPVGEPAPTPPRRARRRFRSRRRLRRSRRACSGSTCLAAASRGPSAPTARAAVGADGAVAVAMPLSPPPHAPPPHAPPQPLARSLRLCSGRWLRTARQACSRERCVAPLVAHGGARDSRRRRADPARGGHRCGRHRAPRGAQQGRVPPQHFRQLLHAAPFLRGAPPPPPPPPHLAKRPRERALAPRPRVAPSPSSSSRAISVGAWQPDGAALIGGLRSAGDVEACSMTSRSPSRKASPPCLLRSPCRRPCATHPRRRALPPISPGARRRSARVSCSDGAVRVLSSVCGAPPASCPLPPQPSSRPSPSPRPSPHPMPHPNPLTLTPALTPATQVRGASPASFQLDMV